MGKKAIRAELRKTSESFPNWYKYEITIQHDDGKIENIPAYGKDLQDALSRVVHDEKIEKIVNFTTFIPEWIWPTTWFAYLFVVGWAFMETGNHNYLVGGFILAIVAGLIFLKLFSKRNVKK